MQLSEGEEGAITSYKSYMYTLLKHKESDLIYTSFHFDVLNWFHNENIVKD